MSDHQDGPVPGVLNTDRPDGPLAGHDGVKQEPDGACPLAPNPNHDVRPYRVIARDLGPIRGILLDELREAFQVFVLVVRGDQPPTSYRPCSEGIDLHKGVREVALDACLKRRSW